MLIISYYLSVIIADIILIAIHFTNDKNEIQKIRKAFVIPFITSIITGIAAFRRELNSKDSSLLFAIGWFVFALFGIAITIYFTSGIILLLIDTFSEGSLNRKNQEDLRERRIKLQRQKDQEERQHFQNDHEKFNKQIRLDARLQEQENFKIHLAKKDQQDIFCEKGTIYCTEISAKYHINSSEFTFNTLRSLSRDHGVYDELERGVAKLDSYEQLSQYIFSFGLMHQAKLQQAFESLFSSSCLTLIGQNIEIIDYGCGQGVGVVCFVDYIKAYTNRNCSITEVKLIEPSELALKRAVLNVRYSLKSFNQSENVFAINKNFDKITQNDLVTQITTTKFHIFSNIIDVEDFNIRYLQEKISVTQQGINFFICVSPNTTQRRNQRLDWFQQQFINKGNVTPISNRETDIPNPRNTARPWKRYERIFKAQLHPQSELEIKYDDDLPF